MRGLVLGVTKEPLFCVTNGKSRSWRTNNLHIVMSKFVCYGWYLPTKEEEFFTDKLTRLVLPLEFM